MSEQPLGQNAEASSTSAGRNPFAIAGLTLGIISVFLYFIGILPILAVVFSSLGLRKNRSYRGRGKVQAWTGLVLGVIYTLMYMRMYGHLG